MYLCRKRNEGKTFKLINLALSYFVTVIITVVSCHSYFAEQYSCIGRFAEVVYYQVYHFHYDFAHFSLKTRITQSSFHCIN